MRSDRLPFLIGRASIPPCSVARRVRWSMESDVSLHDEIKAHAKLVAAKLVAKDVKGEEDMTKAKARQRAKAKASQKARKRDANADRSGQNIQPGRFDPGASSIKSPRVNANAKNFAGAKRGAARSR